MCPPVALSVKVEEASAPALAPVPALQQREDPPRFKPILASESAWLLSQRGREQPTESLNQYFSVLICLEQQSVWR